MIFKLNLWFFINIRLLRVKLINTISYFILAINNLSQKNLKIFYKTYSFENIYLVVVNWMVIIIFTSYIFI